jgi:thiamine kinase-like enzyme
MENRFLLITLMATLAYLQGGFFEKIVATEGLSKNDRCMLHGDSCKDYSLAELFENLPDVYVAPIQEALSTIVSQDKLESVRFSPLLGGLSTSRMFQTIVDEKKYVLRLFDPKRAIERRRSEIEGLRIGARLQIAPQLIYANEAALVAVLEFIEGRTFTHEDLDNKELVKKLMRAVRTFHDYADGQHLIRAQIKKIDTIQARRERCVKEGAVYPSCYDDLFQQLKNSFATLCSQPCPVHGDLKPENVIIANDGGVYLIDWAEACIENPLYDIGWFASFSGASPEQMHSLLREYCQREPNTDEVRETFIHKDFATLFLATAWIGRQEVKDQTKLDALLESPLEKGASYIKRGITTTLMTKKSGIEVTLYALGWLKEFIEDRYQDPAYVSTVN